MEDSCNFKVVCLVFMEVFWLHLLGQGIFADFGSFTYLYLSLKKKYVMQGFSISYASVYVSK